MRDLYHNVQFKMMVEPATSNHVNTWLGYVDTQRFEGIVIGCIIGTLTGVATGNSVLPTLYECDATPTAAGSYSEVAAADILGAFTVVDSTAKDAVVQAVGYKGSKRYVALKSVYTGTLITAGYIGSFVGAGLAHDEPATTPTLTVGTVS